MVGYLSYHSRISADCLPLFFSALSFNYVQLLLTFAASNPRRVRYLRANRCGRDDIYEKGVYLTLCLWRLENFATFQSLSKGKATVDVHWDMFNRQPMLYPWHSSWTTWLVYISAWASALLVLTVMGNAKASSCGTSDSDRLPRFFVYVLFRLIVIDLGRGLPRIAKT